MEVPSIEGGALQKGRRILAITVFSIEYPAEKLNSQFKNTSEFRFEYTLIFLNDSLSLHWFQYSHNNHIGYF